MQQERNVIPGHIQISRVNFGDVGQSIEVLDLRAIRIVNNFAVLAIRKAKNLVEWPPLRKLNNRVIELATAYEVDSRAVIQRLFGRSRYRRTDKGNLDPRIRRFNGLSSFLVSLSPWCAGEQHHKRVLL